MVIRTIALITLFSALGGCAANLGPASWKKGQTPPVLSAATQDGVYSLFEEKADYPLWSGVLEHGERYGFTMGDRGQVVGYAEPVGTLRLAPLAKGYYWKMESKKKTAK